MNDGPAGPLLVDQLRFMADRYPGEPAYRDLDAGSTFADLPGELSGELAVVNDTRVVPARIRIERPKGEVLLLEHEGGRPGAEPQRLGQDSR